MTFSTSLQRLRRLTCSSFSKKNSKIIIKHCRILSVLLHCGSELQGFRGSEWGYLYNTKNLIFFGSVTWSSLHFGKLSKFSIKCFQKKKKTGLKRPTLIQNPSGYWVILLVDKNLVHNLKNIAIFFSRAIDVISICNNTKENFLREPEKIKVKSQKRHLHMQFSEFYLFFTILVKFDIYFLGLSREIVFGVITEN